MLWPPKVNHFLTPLLWEVLQSEFVKRPSSVEEWLGASRHYEQIWNFPNCVGGKEIIIQAPKHAGSSFHNYKGTHSVVLLAVFDAHYRLIMVDDGGPGRHSDGRILSKSEFGRALERNCLSLPPDRPLQGMSTPVPYIFVDEAFP